MVGEWSCDMWGNHATCSCCRPFWGGEVFLWTSKHDLLYTMKNYHWRCNCSARVGDTLSHYPSVLLFFSFSSWIVARMELWQTFLHFAGTNQRIARLGQEASKPEVEGKCCVFYTREYKNWKIMFPPKIVYTPRQSWPARLDALLPCILCYRQLFWPWFFWATQQFRFGVGNVQPVLWVPRQLCTILHGSMQLDDYLACAKCCLATSTGESWFWLCSLASWRADFKWP